MLQRREFISIAATGATWILGGSLAPVSTSTQMKVEMLLSAMGGRAAWSRVKGLSIAARHFETSLPNPYDNLLQIALDQPLMRFQARGEGISRLRVVIGQRGWRRTESTPLRPMSPAAVKDDLNWWEAHVYRNIKRLAVGDRSIEPRVHVDGRLEIYKADGSRLMWYRLNRQGEPVAFGPFDREYGTVLGPLQEAPGGIKLPIWSASHDGTFRAVNQRPTPHETAPDIRLDSSLRS